MGNDPAYQSDVARLSQHYVTVRQTSEALCEPLATEDYVVQSMTNVSPPKWHLAHTTWFFETFLLIPFADGYRPFHAQYAHLFNSYYETLGNPFPRARRGLLSRPTVSEIYGYRHYVDDCMARLMASKATDEKGEVATRIRLGLHHEQQHQELLLMDIKYNFSVNPLHPVYRKATQFPSGGRATEWVSFTAGVYEVGSGDDGFAFDNERPRHPVFVGDFSLASRSVTNAEYLEFIEDDGYQRPELWLSDGLRAIREQEWGAPLYWEKREGQWWQMTLSGMQPLVPSEPVCHVSYFEADAFARWAGKRLPREEEWELAARNMPLEGNFLENGHLRPLSAGTDKKGLRQMFGDVWEWTASPYAAYPGYRRGKGAFGEYNGKFMSGQFVLRGGCCLTPASHIRGEYRNFFYPSDRWQAGGIRLAD